MGNARLRARLNRLQASAGSAPGCLACQERRGLSRFVRVEEQPDGSLTYPDGEPHPCASCGRVPERLIEIVEKVVVA